MAQDKKFGTFGGVFTPSILTILGVIMYLRLPWIVGQAGFFLTAGIILVAHIVSISTGLSVSSIATDKKVKAGGTYYIISRSLGLPIGGTLGVALFFGLSFSVSLYIIGFSESFLGFWGLPITKDTIRIAGTIAVLLVATLTFISTSLAIKTQYFIMTAIALSLVTIIFGNKDFMPVEPLLNSIPTMAPIIMLFAIFFPAVTGFEAGVSMSGDLRDPKKSIPIGTISAISVGLIVYISLAAFFAYRVNSEQLVNNPNILLELSFFPPLLVAGIWGATLSSAIGSILGAPRILQATSVDRIMPRIFAKGYGKTNEPRNALILTFIIAEIGILVGELNLIARIVSMFFITTYGFLNLSSALENWASTDFRPSFKIPTFVSIIGAVVCFILMLELDFIALIGATIIMGAIFLYLKQKELTLESGDTWEGVWSSVLRSGLNRLHRTIKQQRNWRPNIILFSGGANARPHLMEFGRWLVYKRGILSNFNLIENKKAKNLIPKIGQPLQEKEEKFQGIFKRQMEVNEIYEGMETITKVYGFAGLEPNSVMFGWARKSKNPEKFAELIATFKELDYNIFILDYDRERGFGSQKTIDLWWGGGSNNVTLGFTLIKFLQMSEEWDQSQARIFIVSDDSSLHNRIYKNVSNILEEQRIQATLKIINNAIEGNPIQEIIKKESMDSDLVILGLPPVNKQNSSEFISKTDQIIETLGSVLLIQASSFFKPLYIGVERVAELRKSLEKFEKVITLREPLPELILPEHELLAARMAEIISKIEETFSDYIDSNQRLIHTSKLGLIKEIESLVQRNFDELEETLSTDEIHRSRKSVGRVQSNYLFNARRLIMDFQNDILPEQKENLQSGLQKLSSELIKINDNIEDDFIAYYQDIQSPEMINKKSFWKSLQIWKSKKPIRRKIPLAALFDVTKKTIERNVILRHLEEYGVNSYRQIAELQKLLGTVSEAMQIIESTLEKETYNESLFKRERSKLETKIKSYIDSLETDYSNSIHELLLQLRQITQNMANHLEKEGLKRRLKTKNKRFKKIRHKPEMILKIPDAWFHNLELITNFFLADLALKNFQNRIETILERFINEIQLNIDNHYADRLEEVVAILNSINNKEKENISWPTLTQEYFVTENLVSELLKDIQLALEDLPESIEIMAEETHQKIEEQQFGDIMTMNISLRRYVDFLIANELIEPLQNQLSVISKKLQTSIEIAQDVVRFTNYNLSLLSDSEQASHESLSSAIKRGLKRIGAEEKTIADEQESLQQTLTKLQATLFEKLNPYLVSKFAGELKQSIRTQESRKILSGVVDFGQRLKIRGKNLLVRIIYQRSESVLLAKKIVQQNRTHQTETGYVLDMVKRVTPDSEIERTLPFYYRHLFLGKRMINKEFLIERKYEMEQASVAIDLYKQGYHGGLLILGERYSGKSTISQSITAKYFDRQKTYQIYPPEEGSTDPSRLKKKLTEAFQQNGTYDQLFNTIPLNSAIVFHDLELWWERSNDGFNVIDEIIELINRFSERCFFISNIGTSCYHFMNRIKSIENNFISAIECQSFDAEEIQEAILLRHRSTGIKFELDKLSEENISNLKLARLFNRYFDISRGNIGLAIQYWISNIVKVKPQLIQIRTPLNINEQALDRLNMEWLVLLQQFILHKHLSKEKIRRILDANDVEVNRLINAFKRSGLIRDVQDGIFQINPYIQPLLTHRLTELDLL